MNEERTKVLEMLADGKITIEQANQLIDVLGETPLSMGEEKSKQEQRFERKGAPEEYHEQQRYQETPRNTHFSIDQLIMLSEHGVDPTYLKGLREAGLTNLTVEQIIELSEHDIKPAYIKALQEAGLVNLTVDQVNELSDHDIKPTYIKALQEAGFSNLTVEEIIELSESAMDPSYLKALRGVSD